MDLLRFAMLQLGSAADDWRDFAFEHDGVEVDTIQTRGGPEGNLLVVAAVELEQRPEVTSDGLVQVPDEPRRRGEAALQHAADLLSVVTGASRALSSPSLTVAFRVNDDERTWLDGQAGLAGADRALARPRLTVRLEEHHVAALGDRLDGVSLLAEALATSHLTGRFHELIRLFERAFGESADRLVPPLADFLGAWPLLSYTKTEVKRWIVRLRGPATHGDRHKVVLAADLRAVIDRMTLAAYDVLLNKKNWWDRSTDRRDTWRPESGALSPDGQDIFVRQHSTGRMEAQLLDRFGAFPLNTAAAIVNDLGDDCWPRRGPAKTNAAQGLMRVVAAEDIAPNL